MMPLKPPRPLTCQQVAERLGISERTVRRLIVAGDIKAYQPGRRSYRVRPADLDEYLAQIQTRPAHSR